MNDQATGGNGAVLIALGELKGGLAAIQSFLASHTERMDRQDERMDRQDERLNSFSRKLHEHNQADVATHEAQVEKISKVKSELSDRIGDVEKKIAYWSGGLAAASLLTGYVLKKLGLA